MAESSNTPLASSGRNWAYSFWQFWTPIDTCMMAWCCPCFLFGKTQARLEDPTLANYSPINDNCLIFCGLNCFAASFLIVTKKRDEMRQKLGISETHLEEILKMEKGDIKKKHGVEEALVEDCLASFWCPCCTLVQAEKEAARIKVGEVEATGYKKTQGMQYP